MLAAAVPDAGPSRDFPPIPRTTPFELVPAEPGNVMGRPKKEGSVFPYREPILRAVGDTGLEPVTSSV